MGKPRFRTQCAGSVYKSWSATPRSRIELYDWHGRAKWNAGILITLATNQKLTSSQARERMVLKESLAEARALVAALEKAIVESGPINRRE